MSILLCEVWPSGLSLSVCMWGDSGPFEQHVLVQAPLPDIPVAKPPFAGLD